MSQRGQNLLERIVLAAERYVDAHPTFEVGPLLLVAVSGAALREVTIARSQLPRGVRWVMMSCQMQDPAAWQAISLGEGDPITSRPISIALPDALATSLAEVATARTQDKNPEVPAILKPLELNATGISVAPLPPVGKVYFRSSVIRLPEPHSSVRVGSIVGTSDVLEDSEEASLDYYLSTAERVVADRLFQGLGGYRPVASILAAIDDGFQNSLIAARSIPDLAAILESFKIGEGKPIAVVSSQLTRVKEADFSAVPQPSVDTSDLKRTIRGYLVNTYQVPMNDVILQVSPTADVSGRYGNWHAFAQFGFGLGGLRSQSVLFSVCETRECVEQSLARYVAIVQANTKNVEIVIFLAGTIQNLWEHYTKTWTQVKGVHFGRMR